MTVRSPSGGDSNSEMGKKSIPWNWSSQDILLVILLIMAGALLMLNLLPLWGPGIINSITGEDPKVFWFLSRGSAITAYWILWLSMALGISITNKLAQAWPGIPPAYEIHQYVSLLGLGFGLFHAFILMGDQYISYNFSQILIPFTALSYRPVWVGVGQISFYIWLVVAASFFVRKHIGKKNWRNLHFASYLVFLGVMFHSLFSGTDTSSPFMQGLYWFSGASLLFLTVFRVLSSSQTFLAKK